MMFSRLPMMIMKFHHLGGLMIESLMKNSRTVVVDGHSRVINNTRSYTDEADNENKERKEEKNKIKMPGFTHPETAQEDNFFSKLTKEQIEELKKKTQSGERDN